MGLKKRILLIADVKGWGGWTRGEYLIKYLSDQFYLQMFTADEFNEWEVNSNKKYFTSKEVKRYMPLAEDGYINFENFKQYVNSIKKMRNFDLYYFLFHTMLVKKSVKRMLRDGEPIITAVTGFPTVKPIFYDRNKNEHNKAIKKFLNLANKCQAIVANNRKTLQDLRGIYTGPSFYTPRGVDQHIFYPMAAEPNRNKKFTVAYVGKPVPEKGLKEFIQPACEIAGCNLIINDRNYTNALPPEEMNKFYNKADAYVVASTIDGTPNPALEAAACGKPIISNPIGNMPEFIQHGKNGFLFKDRNINKYASALRKLMDDRELAFTMGQNARKKILNGWTWRHTCELEREMLRSVL